LSELDEVIKTESKVKSEVNTTDIAKIAEVVKKASVKVPIKSKRVDENTPADLNAAVNTREFLTVKIGEFTHELYEQSMDLDGKPYKVPANCRVTVQWLGSSWDSYIEVFSNGKWFDLNSVKNKDMIEEWENFAKFVTIVYPEQEQDYKKIIKKLMKNDITFDFRLFG
jgi:hypothetical protein